MSTALSRLDDGTIEVTLTFPWKDISTMYEAVVSDSVKNAELSGFRKGKAPRKMVEDTLDKTKVYEEVIKRLVPQAYTEAVTTHKLKPILMPQVELKEANEGKDWQVVAKTAEAPKVTLGDYKKAIKEVKAAKTKKIFVPGQKEDEQTKDDKPSLDDILSALLSASTVTLPKILVEHETNHQLSGLIDQTRKLGMTVEQYLASTGKTTESIRAEYAQQTIRTLSLEFALEAVADREGIKVEDSDIEKILATAKTPEERASMEKERYYVTSVLRRQKTVDALAAL